MDTKSYKVGDTFTPPKDVSICPAMSRNPDTNVIYGCSRENGHALLTSLVVDHLAAEPQPSSERNTPPVWKVVYTWRRILG